MNNTSGQPNGTLILVLGILGIVLCQILGPVAWIMGNNAMTLLDSGQGDESQRGNVNAGRICRIVGTVLLVLSILGSIAYFVFFGALLAAASQGSGSTR
jgi:uncharacterized membrane protein YjgN (DUF898 family)